MRVNNTHYRGRIQTASSKRREERQQKGWALKGPRMGMEGRHIVYIYEDRQRTSRKVEEAHREDRG